ncbi:methylated-DNA--[protein]-cysteine S-methyltransferase [Hydrogenophaga sp.]|uniref:methylated-DNA--[protein]-cysteine S-methyltransferase n=1 Tax=Hydrogenophaga sp. TaxID=1904254 RepID=UPI003D098547
MKHDPATVFTEWHGPLGPMVLAATPRGLSGIWFEGQRHGPVTSSWRRAADVPVLQQAMAQLTAYFAGRRTAFDLPLDLGAGTAFQQRVWQALRQIAPGGTTSYGALSARIGSPAAVRAVGAAVGRNPVSIVVPCHRVIGTDGSLTGYAGGLERKTALLALEGAALH